MSRQSHPPIRGLPWRRNPRTQLASGTSFDACHLRLRMNAGAALLPGTTNGEFGAQPTGRTGTRSDRSTPFQKVNWTEGARILAAIEHKCRTFGPPGPVPLRKAAAPTGPVRRAHDPLLSGGSAHSDEKRRAGQNAQTAGESDTVQLSRMSLTRAGSRRCLFRTR